MRVRRKISASVCTDRQTDKFSFSHSPALEAAGITHFFCQNNEDKFEPLGVRPARCLDHSTFRLSPLTKTTKQQTLASNAAKAKRDEMGRAVRFRVDPDSCQAVMSQKVAARGGPNAPPSTCSDDSFSSTSGTRPNLKTLRQDRDPKGRQWRGEFVSRTWRHLAPSMCWVLSPHREEIQKRIRGFILREAAKS